MPVTVGFWAPRKKMPGKPGVSKPSLGLRAQRRVLDRHRAGAVVAHEEDRAAALVGVVVLDDRAGDPHGELVAVAVDRAAAAAARACRPRPGWRRCRSPCCSVSTLLSTTHDTPMLLSAPPLEQRRPGPTRRRTCCPRRRPAGSWYWLSTRIGRAAEVGAGAVAAVADEARVDHLEPPAAHEDRAAAAALGGVAGGVAVGEGQVLHGELRVRPGPGSARWSSPGPRRRCSCRGCGAGPRR